MSKEKHVNIIILKHWMLRLGYMIKFIFIGIFAIVLSFVSFSYRKELGSEITLYLFFPLVIALINYSIFRLIFALIEYYNYLFIVTCDQIIIINASLILRNDIEVIEAFKIIKLDSFSRGFFQNILNYGNITIELQTKEERIFRFMPKPHQLLGVLQKQRELVLSDRKSKYIIDEENTKNKE